MNAFKKTLLTISMLGALVPATIGLAEDTDIYAIDNGAANNPNVLVIIDNSANWSAANQGWPGGIKQGQSELKALRTVIADLDENVNLGLMMFTPGSGSNMNGGYVRFAVRTMNATNKAAFQEMLGNPAGCTDGANSLNNTPNCIYQNFNAPAEKVGTSKTDYSAAMFEAFKYFGGYTCPDHATDDVAACDGGTVDASHFGALRYAGDPDASSDAAAYSGGASKSNYESPLSAANSCAKNYVIFIGNGYPTQDSASTLLTGVGGNTTQLSVPDFQVITGVSPTLLGTGTYASQAACEAAATVTYGAAYASYTCSQAGTNTSTTTLATSNCGNYGSVAACETAAVTAYPGYDSYSCTVAGSCAGNTSLGTSVCGQYSSVAECEIGTAAAFPGFTSYSCTLSATACTSATTTLATTSCGQYATEAACEAAAPASFPGYASYNCTSAGSCTTADIDGAACYVSSANCQSTALATNPGYNSVSCTSASNCTSVVATTCAAANAYNNAANCNAGAPAVLGGTYASYSCSAGANCAGGKTWTITGTNQSYTATGTGTRWTVTGTDPAGSRYNMTGVGGGSTYTITGTSTTVTWNIYGNNTVMSAVPTGTYSGTSANYADEWARFLYQTDANAAVGQQNVRTYTIDVYKDQQDANETKLLMSMAMHGGGKYFSATNENSIKNALLKIFSEINSVNSVFASSSLPVSVNTQGTYLNQVFIGMFRPNGNATPRWAGNLKQYQFDINAATNMLFLADKDGDEAINATTGFITPCADSIWTTDTGNYWNFGGSNAQGSCGAAQTSAFPAAGSSAAYSDAPDGDVVEKGGAAQKLRGVTSSGGVLTSSSTRYAVCGSGETPVTHSCRKLLTCNNLACSSLLEFSTANAGAASSNPSLTAASLGATNDTERDALIGWVRGQDINDENGNTVTAEVRPSVHGAVVHSQPAVIDYGGATGVYAFYGADDGVFHAVNSDKNDVDGVEAWGFIAPETYGRLKRFRENDPLVDFPGVNMAITPTPQPKSYFFDGSIGTYQNSGTVWIFPTMRRGGRAIYAFDVSTPTSPVLKWRKGCFTNDTADNSNCSAGWSGIGQTWSKPQIGYLSGYVDGSNNPKPVLIFGGGYDTCEDTNSQTRCVATPRKGANIWFIDADTGAILRTYPTNYSVAGDVFVTRDSNNNVTSVYAADTGGYLYRINVGSTNTDASTFTSWSSNSAATDTDIAYLSEANHARKFLFGPDVVRYPTYNAVLVGTGDREHPLQNDYACGNYSEVAGEFVTNQFFMVKDLIGGSYPETLITPSDLTDVTSDTTGGTAIGANGWRFELGQQCEQVVNKALAIAGVVYFGTYQPLNTEATACSTDIGTARGYAVNVEDASSVCPNCLRSVTYAGGGLPPSPVAGVVEINGARVPFLLGGSKPTDEEQCVGEGCSPLGGTKIDVNPTSARHRIFWYIKSD